MKKSTFLFLNLFLLLYCTCGLAQEYEILGVTSGFNADVIANGIGPANGSTTHRVDDDSFNYLSLDFKATSNSPDAPVGLPVNGLIAARNIAGLSFQLQPYSQRNSLRIKSLNSTDSLVFSTRERMQKMYLLTTAGSAGNLPAILRATIKFSDGTSQISSGLTVADWYGGTAAQTVIGGIGRVNVTNNSIETPSGNPKMFSVEINLDLLNYNKQVVSVEIVKTSNANAILNVFAVSYLKTPACLEPQSISIADVTTNSATVNWSDINLNPSQEYEYELRTSGLPGSGNTGLVDSGSVANAVVSKSFSGLSSGTSFLVFLRSKCTATSVSVWTAGHKFVTACVWSEFTTSTAVSCGDNSAILTASAAQGSVRWFDRAIGGNVVGTTDTLVTPILFEPTRYWVASQGPNAVENQSGKILINDGPLTSTFVNYGIMFDASEDIVLKSVDVFPTQSGTLDIKIVNTNGQEIYSTGIIAVTVSENNKAVTIPLDVDIVSGSGYRMLIKSFSDLSLYYDVGNVNFPYSDADRILTVPRSVSSTANATGYRYFYNLYFQKGCVSPRREVLVENSPAPVFSLSGDQVVFCAGQVPEPITIVTGGEIYDSYTWSPSNGVSGDAENGWVFDGNLNQTYTLKASQSVGGSCQVFKKIEVISLPDYEPIYLQASGCLGEAIPLEVVNPPNRYTQIGADSPSSFANNLSAFNNYRRSARVQLLFTAAELNNLGLSRGLINSIAFDVISLGSSAENQNYTVDMGPTNLTKFEEDSNFVLGNFTPVFTPKTYTHTDSGWQEILFDTPYYWDGQSNLIIELAHQGSNLWESAGTKHTVTEENKVLYGYDNGNASASKNRFNIKFGQSFSLEVSWLTHTGSLFLDAAARIPYLSDGKTNKVYYKPSHIDANTVTATIDFDGCLKSKIFNVTLTEIESVQILEEQQLECGQVAISEIPATGENLKWYRTADRSTPIPDTTILEAGDYYVTQTINGCESSPKRFIVTFVGQPNPPLYQDKIYCGTTFTADIALEYNLENTLNWYDQDHNLISATTELTSGLYYVTQKNGDCESNRTEVNLTINPATMAPEATSIVLCGLVTVADLNPSLLPNAIGKWYLDLDSTVALDSTLLVGTRTYYLSQTILGCESPRVAVSVLIYSEVGAPLVENQMFCTTAVRVSDLVVTTITGAVANWYQSEQDETPLLSEQILQTGMYYVSQSVGICNSAKVAVQVDVIDNAVTPNIPAQIFCGTATVSQLLADMPENWIVKWYNQETGGTALAGDTILQSGVYYASQSMLDCESARARVQITINEIPQAPTGQAQQEFEGSAVVGDLVTDQEQVVWFESLVDAQENTNRLDRNHPLSDGKVYYGILFSVEACWGQAFAVTVKITLGIQSFDLKQLHYYPNPVRDILKISYKEKISKIEVYSLNGQLLLEEKAAANSVEANLSTLAKATYIVKIFAGTDSQTVKVIKQ